MNTQFELNDQRQTYIRFLRSIKPRYHLTVTFSYGTNERICTMLLNNLIKFINRATLKSRYEKHGQFIKGIAVKERTFAMETVHFHILLADPDLKLPEARRMREIISNKIRLINRNSNRLNQIDNFLLQGYYNYDKTHSLERYLTKIFEKTTLGQQEKRDSYYPLGHGGIDF